VLDVVYESLLVGQRFEAKYHSRNAIEPSEYEVNLMTIVYRNNVSYLVCTLWKYTDIKQLVMHRFQTAKPLDKAVIFRRVLILMSISKQVNFLILIQIRKLR